MYFHTDPKESISNGSISSNENYNNIFRLIEKKNHKVRRVGLGTFSLFLIIFAMVFIINVQGEPSIGDNIFIKLGIKTWSRINWGFHYPVLVSLLISYLALFLSEKYHYQIGGKLARMISRVYSILLTSIIMVYIYI